jgi:acyl-CoA thioester hydrolase
MPEAWPDLAGRLTDGVHVLPVRVYFEDTDFSGVVYHANYLRFMERGRSDFLRLLGIGHEALDAGGPGERLAFAVSQMRLEFVKPARIDELLEVHTRVGEITGARIVLTQEVRRGDTVLVSAIVTVALLSRSGKVQRLPADMRGRLVAAGKG